MPIGSGIVYNTGDLILSQVSSSGTAFLETKIAAATSSLIYFDSTARINSASLNSITVGTASYVSGSTSIITNLTASNISASGTSSFGYVGIGTTNPSDKLSIISGSVRIASTSLAGALFLGNDTSNIYLQRDNSYDLSLVQNGDSNSALYLASAGNVYVNIDSNNNDTDKAFIVQNNALKTGTELFRVSETGNVGIGTSIPSQKLHIKSTDTFAAIKFTNSVSDAGIISYSSDNLYFYTANAQRITIDTAGNVGIGTTVPGALLDVSYGDYQNAGTIRIGADIGVSISRTNNTRKYGAITGFPYNNASASIQVIGIDAQGPTITGLTIGGGGTGFASPTQIQFYTTSSTIAPGAERMRIDSSGNVGIGTSSPSYLLDVYKTSNDSVIRVRTIGAGAYLYLDSATDGWYGINLLSGSTSRWFMGGYGTTSFTITRGIGATEYFRIDTAGNVGIGTTNPVAKLQVAGNVSGSSFTSSISNAVGFLGTASWAQNVVTASYLVPTNSYTITNLTASGVVKASQIAEKVVTFTPLSGSITGAPAWYRIISGSGVLDSGRVRMSANYDNSRSDIEFTYAVRNYDTDGAGAFINITRASTYNSLFNAVRVIETGNLAEPYAIDVLIGNYLNNTSPGPITCLYESQFIGAVLDTPTFVSASATGSNIVKTVYTTYTSGYPRIGPTYSDGLAVATVQGQLTVGYRGNYAYNAPSTLNYALLVSGSVGIGTSNPTAKLTIVDNTNGGTINLVGRTSDDTAAINFRATGDASTYAYVSPDTNEFRLYHNDGFMSFYPGGTEKVRITSGGNVGIGTTVPSGSLTVQSNANQLRLQTTSGPGAYFTEISSRYDSTHPFQLGVANNSSTATEFFGIYADSGGSNNRSVFPTGNVGIGTTSPNSKLEVAGGSGTAIISINNTTAGRSGSFGIDSNGVYIQNSNNGDYFDLKNASGTARFRVIYDNATHLTTNFVSIGNLSATGSKLSVFGNLSVGSTYGSTAAPSNGAIFQGSVGIGTTSPDSNLHVYSTSFEPAIRLTSTSGSTKTYGLVNNPGWATGSFHIYDFTTDNSRIHISSTGNIGLAVGSTTPANRLDVVGDLRVRAAGAAMILDTATTSDGRMEYKYNGTRKALIGVDSDNLQIAADSGNFLQFRTNNTQRMIINNSGGVGIGTSSPLYLVDIYDTGANSAMMSLRSSGSGNARIYFDAANGDLVGSDYCYLGQDDSTLNFVINTSNAAGNIHLQPKDGTNNGILYVSGSTRFGRVISQTHEFTGSINLSGSLNATASWANNVVSASYATTAQTANALNTGNSYTVSGLTNNGTLSQQGTLSMGSGYQILATTGTTSNPGIAFVGDTNTGIYSSGADTIGLVTGGSEKVTINSTGNVGIGTTSPGAKLDVVGGINSSTANNFNITSGPYNAVFYNNSTSSTDYNAIRIYQGASGSAVGYFGTGGSATGNVSFRNTFVVGTQNSNDFVLNTTDTERVRITSGGNVGIGTTTPNAKLDVNGNIIVTGSLTTTSTIVARNYIMATDTLYIQKGVGGYQSYITAEQTAASTGNSFKFWNSGTGTLMTIGYNGYVGIGTTSPTYQLHVNGGPTEVGGQVVAAFEKQSSTDGKIATFVNTTGSGYTSYIYIGSNPGRDWKIGKNVLNSGTTGHFQITNDLNQLRMQISAADDSITFPSSSVGIGTTNATDKLTVYGAMASYKTGADTVQTQVYLANGGNTRAFNLQLNSGGTGLDLWSYNSANAWLKHTTFDYDGRVGIGTAAPAAKLEISGSSNSALLHVKSPISGAILYVSGSGAVGINTSTVGAYTLQVNGSFAATTKSFVIDHPTKAGKRLIYGSLESPYHGIRLTGRDTLKDGKCKIQLPDYIYKLILHDSVNIQLTGIKCNKTLYVDDINIPENYFTIAYDKALFESYKDYDFFWDFTAIRADVPELNTEL